MSYIELETQTGFFLRKKSKNKLEVCNISSLSIYYGYLKTKTSLVIASLT